MTGEEKQSYLTKSDADSIHETLHGFLLFGVVIVVFSISVIDERSKFTVGMITIACFGLFIAMRRGVRAINSFTEKPGDDS